MIQEATSQPPENKGRPFMEIPPLWLKVFRMDETFFSSETPHTSIPNTAFSVLLMTGITVVLTFISAGLGSLVGFSKSGASTFPTAAVGTVLQLTAVLTCCGLILTPLSFYLNNGITYLGALLFGGKGTYSAQAYLDSIFYVPLTFISGLFALLAVIPTYGPWIVAVITLAVALFDVVLMVRVFKVVHQLSTGRAIGAILIPLALVLIPICIILVLMIMGPLIGNVFSTINASLSTPSP